MICRDIQSPLYLISKNICVEFSVSFDPVLQESLISKLFQSRAETLLMKN